MKWVDTVVVNDTLVPSGGVKIKLHGVIKIEIDHMCVYGSVRLQYVDKCV